jgi:hypothetical protein
LQVSKLAKCPSSLQRQLLILLTISMCASFNRRIASRFLSIIRCRRRASMWYAVAILMSRLLDPLAQDMLKSTVINPNLQLMMESAVSCYWIRACALSFLSLYKASRRYIHIFSEVDSYIIKCNTYNNYKLYL